MAQPCSDKKCLSWPNGTLRVWLDGNKNRLYVKTEVSVSEPITPAFVAKVIKKKREQG